jgi:hypothetical protein
LVLPYSSSPLGTPFIPAVAARLPGHYPVIRLHLHDREVPSVVLSQRVARAVPHTWGNGSLVRRAVLRTSVRGKGGHSSGFVVIDCAINWVGRGQGANPGLVLQPKLQRVFQGALCAVLQGALQAREHQEKITAEQLAEALAVLCSRQPLWPSICPWVAGGDTGRAGTGDGRRVSSERFVRW